MRNLEAEGLRIGAMRTVKNRYIAMSSVPMKKQDNKRAGFVSYNMVHEGGEKYG